ncbi:hypothetical protein C8R46DRAFT_1229294 [Mycena filopes]|nr:hypothetical protein C8R46DRAFT_1229294 [Mycena filopes]
MTEQWGHAGIASAQTRLARMETVKKQAEEALANKIYEYEAMVCTRLGKKTGEWEYRVKWVGYGDNEDTWEPAGQLVSGDVLSFWLSANPDGRDPFDVSNFKKTETIFPKARSRSNKMWFVYFNDPSLDGTEVFAQKPGSPVFSYRRICKKAGEDMWVVAVEGGQIRTSLSAMRAANIWAGDKLNALNSAVKVTKVEGEDVEVSQRGNPWDYTVDPKVIAQDWTDRVLSKKDVELCNQSLVFHPRVQVASAFSGGECKRIYTMVPKPNKAGTRAYALYSPNSCYYACTLAFGVGKNKRGENEKFHTFGVQFDDGEWFEIKKKDLRLLQLRPTDSVELSESAVEVERRLTSGEIVVAQRGVVGDFPVPLDKVMTYWQDCLDGSALDQGD